MTLRAPVATTKANSKKSRNCDRDHRFPLAFRGFRNPSRLALNRKTPLMKLALAAFAGVNAAIWLLIFVLDHQLP